MKLQKSSIPFTFLLLIILVGLPLMDYQAKKKTENTLVIQVTQQDAFDSDPVVALKE